MRRLVTMLRDHESDADLAPQPGVGSLTDLITAAEGTGFHVELQVTGDRPDLPAGLDLTVYRIVQEALTNVRRHSLARQAHVALDFGPQALEIVVTDPGPGRGSVSGGSGHGLVGMRERVALFGGQELAASGFRLILERAGLVVVGEAGDGLEAVDLVREHRPDVVLMDIRMPRLDGVEATRRIGELVGPRPRVLVLTTFDLDEYVYNAVRAGASGFLLRDVPPDDLVHAVRVVARGESMLAPALIARLLDRFTARPPVAERPVELAELTDRELEIARLVARGLSNPEIGARLFLSEATVKTYVSRLLAKLHLRDRVQVALLAYRTGLVPLD